MGRRPNDNNNISITDLKVNFISQKKDNYGNDVIYWKCMENSKFKALTYLKEKDKNFVCLISSEKMGILFWSVN